MRNEENRIFSETEKTVIFIHEAVHLIIDESVIADAYYNKTSQTGVE